MKAFYQQGSIFSLSNGKAIIGYGKRENLQKPDNQEDPIFYCPDFFQRNKTPWHRYAHWEEIRLEDLKVDELQTTPIQWNSLNKTEYIETFDQLIANDRLTKAVPYVFLEGKGRIDIRQSLSSLANFAAHFPIYLYGHWNEEEGILGATPELLFQMEGDLLNTVALAGTLPIQQKDRLLSDPKLLEEHDWVIKGIMEDLSSFGTVNRGVTTTLDFPRLSHLHTPISCHLKKERDPLDLVAALHPSPALGGYPKEEAKKWLLDFDKKNPRGRFGAPVGLLYQGKMTAYVAIRNIQWSGESLRIGAGGGIVKQSNVEHEWEELMLKLNAIKSLLKI